MSEEGLHGLHRCQLDDGKVSTVLLERGIKSWAAVDGVAPHPPIEREVEPFTTTGSLDVVPEMAK